MAAQNKIKALQLVLAHEGGYVNHPKDPGGATNKGITQKVYDAYRANQNLDLRSVAEIETYEVEAIYHYQYWATVKADMLPSGIDYAVFDYCVNSGASRAVKDLQRSLNGYLPPDEQLVVDGAMGQSTLNACKRVCETNAAEFVVDYCNRRIDFLRSLKTWSTFGKGWQRRVVGPGPDCVLENAVAMTAKYPPLWSLHESEIPAPVGNQEGEQPGKGMERDQSALKTAKGAGTAITSVGAGGQALLTAAQEVLPHAGYGMFGKLALGAFVLLMLVGVGLLAYDWIKKQKEKSAA